VFYLMVGPASVPESRGSILEELFLPAAEHRRPQPQFLTEIGNPLLLPQMPPQNGDPACGGSPCIFMRSLRYLNGRTLSPFPV
jgi:hypothetical protein